MRVVVFSDVHGNLPAFETMLKHAGKCDLYISLGDLVNYGPWSNECVDLALSLTPCKYIIGNHEEAFIDGCYKGSNTLVNSFFNICFPNFEKVNEIKLFEKSISEFDYTFQHTINGMTIYPDTSIELGENYVIGHTHHQFIYQSNGFTLYNAGSVGQNRKYVNEINYLSLNTENGECELESTTYDANAFIKQLKYLNYPQECIDYYKSKAQA